MPLLHSPPARQSFFRIYASLPMRRDLQSRTSSRNTGGQATSAGLRKRLPIMQRMHRAIVIRNEILGYGGEDWRLASKDGLNHAYIFNENWRAQFWGATKVSMLNDNLEIDVDCYLNRCRMLKCRHRLDVWCDNTGKVLSLYWDGDQFRLIRRR